MKVAIVGDAHGAAGQAQIVQLGGGKLVKRAMPGGDRTQDLVQSLPATVPEPLVQAIEILGLYGGITPPRGRGVAFGGGDFHDLYPCMPSVCI